VRCQALGDLLGGTLDEAKPLFYNEELGEEGRLETERFQQLTLLLRPQFGQNGLPWQRRLHLHRREP
jgi:hypothetical protein